VSPVAAADFALKLSPLELRKRAVLSVLERWSTQEPEQAFHWIAKSSDETLHGEGMARVLNVYAPVSPEAAGELLDQLPAGPDRENAIGNYVEAALPWNPEAATRWAYKSENPAIRQQRVAPCFQMWRAWNPEAAQRWLSETNFHDELKQHWLAEKTAPQS
jgi:hypothetical protein